MSNKKELSMDIQKKVGVVSESPSGWTLQLNFISGEGNEPKYDLRRWNPTMTSSGRGLTLTEEELRALFEIIRQELVHLEKVPGELQ